MKILLSALFLVASLANAAPFFQTRMDHATRWEGEWDLGSFPMVRKADRWHQTEPAVGGLRNLGSAHNVEASVWLALPWKGQWSLQVLEDSTELLSKLVSDPDSTAREFPQFVASQSRTPMTQEVVQGNVRLLHVRLPLLQKTAQGIPLRLRKLRIAVTMSGNGVAEPSKDWKSMIANPSGASRFAGPAPVAISGRSLRTNTSIWSSGSVVAIDVGDSSIETQSENRIIKITGAQLRSAFGEERASEFAGSLLRQVAVWAGPRDTIPEITDSSIATSRLQIIPVRRIDTNGDGLFGDEDALVLYVEGTSFWLRDTANPSIGWQLSVNRWDNRRRYWIQLAAPNPSPEWSSQSSTTAGELLSSLPRLTWIGSHKQVRSVEIGDTKKIDVATGAEWFWHVVSLGVPLTNSQLTTAASKEFSNVAKGEAVVLVRSAQGSFARPDIDTSFFLLNGARASLVKNANFISVWNVANLQASNEWMWVPTQKPDPSDYVQKFESFSVRWNWIPTFQTGVSFMAPTNGKWSAKFSGVTDSSRAYAIENGVVTREISFANGILSDSVRFDDTRYVLGMVHRGDVAKLSLQPKNSDNVSRSWEGTTPWEYVVIAPDSLLDLAVNYGQWRSHSARLRPMAVTVVRAEDLFQQFASGIRDPLAIRDFLRMAKTQHGASHALLMGGGSWDPRGVLGRGAGPLPVFEKGSVVSDEFLTYLDPGEIGLSPNQRLPDIAFGRIPARNREELRNWIDKVKVFEDPANNGPWRNTFLLASDDLQVRDDKFPYRIDQIDHTEQSEQLAATIESNRRWIRLKKLYEVEYPMNAFLEKPEAQRDLIQYLNKGVGAWNYFGHGADFQLSDERLMDKNSLTQFTNSQRPFVLLAGSCTVGRFDFEDQRGLAELMVVQKSKGAVSVIAGTRPSYPIGNIPLSKLFWAANMDSTVGQMRSIGEAFMAAKRTWAPTDYELSGPLSNDRTQYVYGGLFSNRNVYHLLGDPSLVLYPVLDQVTLNPLADTLPALQSFKAEGSSSKQNPLFEVSVLTQKKSKTASVLNPKDGTMSSVTYEQPGSVLISTQVKGSSGGYSAPLIMPARIPFGDTASVSVFGWNNASRSFGGTIRNGFLLSGTGTDSVRDVTGPEVFIRPCDSSWTAGQPLQTRASIPLPFCLQVDLQDSSGISSQEGPDEGVVFSVPGVLDPWHPELRQGDDFRQSSGLFVLSTDEFQTGKSYDFTVLARDLMGNTTRKQLNLKTVQEEAVSLYDVYNSPNPVRGTSTSFYFKLTAKQDSNGVVPAKVRASIRITTMSGKLVRVLETELDGASNGRPTAVWNLQDEFRNPVANGTYPYVVKLRVPMDAGGWKQIERRGAVVISR